MMMFGRDGQDDTGVCRLAGRHDIRVQREPGDSEGPPPHQEQPRHHAGLRDVRQQRAGGAGDTAR